MATVNPLRRPGKVAFAGDWHGNYHWAVKAVKWAREQNVEVILHTGDFGAFFHQRDNRFVTALHEALVEAGIVLLFVDGNHDNHPVLNARPKHPASGLRFVTSHIYFIPRGFRWNWGGLEWMGVGGAHSVDRKWRTEGVDWWPTELITQDQFDSIRAGVGKRGPVDVMITHDAPLGAAIPFRGEPMFDPAEILLSQLHRKRMQEIVDVAQPGLLVHGHYHLFYSHALKGDGFWTEVVGLNMDATYMSENMVVFDMADMIERYRRADNDVTAGGEPGGAVQG